MNQDQSEDHMTADEHLQLIAKLLRAGLQPNQVTVRDFLSWFGAMRRGPWIVTGIRNALSGAGLATEPDFNEVGTAVFIRFVLASPSLADDSVETEKGTDARVAALAPLDSTTETVSAGIGDPTYRLSKLNAAGLKPISVAPDKPIGDAVSLMLSHDFSQLPVMSNDRDLRGVISWRSIGARLALGKLGTYVREFMEEGTEIRADRSLFAALPLIIQHDYVLVRDAEKRISGIVTTADLSAQFQQLTEPFLLLGEIENHVRRLMDGKFTKEELEFAKDPSDVNRKIENVSNLSFGEYIRCLENPNLWSKIGLPIERTIFIADLEAVRTIRNEVMHFDPDPFPESALGTLRRVAKFLGALHGFGF